MTDPLSMTAGDGSRGLRVEQTIEADSRIWSEFPLRPDDVIIASYHKAGTTVTQQIVLQLIFGGQPDVPLARVSPWLDFRLLPKTQVLEELAAQTHRRCLKTHLPADALPRSPQARYIYVARDGRDVAWSFHRHLRNAVESFNDAQWRSYDPSGCKLPGYPAIPESPRDFFLEWLASDGSPHGSFFDNVKSWWEVRAEPNVRLLHFQNIRTDLAGTILGIARFLGVSEVGLPLGDILQHCGLDYMKRHSELFAPLGGAVFKGGAGSFFYKGNNGRWKDGLTEADIEQYEEIARQRLGRDCADWLRTGAGLTA